MNVAEAYSAFSPHAELLKWAQSMGADFRRAWYDCPNGLWLIYLARFLGVPAGELNKLREAAKLPEERDVLKRHARGLPKPFHPADIRDAGIPEIDVGALSERMLTLIRNQYSIEDLIKRRFGENM